MSLLPPALALELTQKEKKCCETQEDACDRMLASIMYLVSFGLVAPLEESVLHTLGKEEMKEICHHVDTCALCFYTVLQPYTVCFTYPFPIDLPKQSKLCRLTSRK